MDLQPTPFEALTNACIEAGGQSALSRICGVSSTAVWKWVQSSKRLPAEFVLKVEAATGVSRHLLRPDIYPIEHPTDPTSAEPTLDCTSVLPGIDRPRQSNRRTVLDERPAA